MHDWTLISLSIDWPSGSMVITFRNSASRETEMKIFGLASLNLPRHQDWGESVSVNSVLGPTKSVSDTETVEIEMQSGDRITIDAKKFVMPPRDE